MTDTNNTWPGKPGVPLNPEKDGWRNVVDLAAKRAPVDYTIRIRKHWDDGLEIFVEVVSDDERSRSKRAVADTLERAAQVFRAKLEGKKA